MSSELRTRIISAHTGHLGYPNPLTGDELYLHSMHSPRVRRVGGQARHKGANRERETYRRWRRPSSDKSRWRSVKSELFHTYVKLRVCCKVQFGMIHTSVRTMSLAK